MNTAFSKADALEVQENRDHLQNAEKEALEALGQLKASRLALSPVEALKHWLTALRCLHRAQFDLETAETKGASLSIYTVSVHVRQAIYEAVKSNDKLARKAIMRALNVLFWDKVRYAESHEKLKKNVIEN